MKVVSSQVIEAFVVLLIAAGIFNTLFVERHGGGCRVRHSVAIGFSPAAVPPGAVGELCGWRWSASRPGAW